MDIVIGTNIYALDDLKQKAEKFCKQNGLDKETLFNDFQAAYEAFNGDKFLLMVNVLNGISKQLSESALEGLISPMVADIINNLYLATAMIALVDDEAQFRNMVDSDE